MPVERLIFLQFPRLLRFVTEMERLVSLMACVVHHFVLWADLELHDTRVNSVVEYVPLYFFLHLNSLVIYFSDLLKI